MRIGKGWTILAAILAAGALVAGCGSGSNGANGKTGPVGPAGPPGAPGPGPAPVPTDPNLAADQALPGVKFAVTALAGASGAGGQFQVGDTIKVTFTLAKADDTVLGLSELDAGNIYVSGPTTHYQRVLPLADDLLTASVKNPNGSYTYTFASPIPAVYAAPYNDTPSFGVNDGEMTGLPLENGTYTVGIEAWKDYFLGDRTFPDVANVATDFLFGTATVPAPRQVVARENCNQCHVSLRIHEDTRRDPKMCVLCHTAGAEDLNDPAVAGGTPGTTIELKVMIHRMHNGKHLPSVLGVATNPDGSRNYLATPKPLLYAGFSDGPYLEDRSRLGFPVWPNLNVAMPRDAGYSALTAAAKTQDDNIRFGVTACAKCHGDPDGAGPLSAPAQGDNAYSVQTRRACGSCHDDVDWSRPYTANGATMPLQASDANCLTCHPASGSSLSPVDGHRHPLLDPAFNPGLNFNITGVTEAGTNNGNGKLDPGEKVQVAFTLKNDAGADVVPTTMSSMSAVVDGPTTNKNLLLVMSFPIAAFGAGPTYGPTYTMNLPETILLEYAGTSTAAGGEVFTTARSPHWNVTGATTTVQTAAVTATATTLSSAAPVYQNFLDVASAAGFLRNDVLVVEGGTANREYLKIQSVIGNRLWLNSIGSLGTYQPFVRKAHNSGVAVTKVTLTTKTTPAQYSLNAATGAVTEAAEFGNVDVVVTYTTDYVLPAKYPPAYNDSPDLDESWGKWVGKPLADGTYTVTLYGVVTRVFTQSGENTSYSGTSPGVAKDFLVGAATAITPYPAISSGTNCYRCHNDLYFHGGGRRGFDTCIQCHGTSGFEDRPQYVAPNAPATTATPVSYRTMLHKIHMGEELPDASTYTVVGFGSGTYPNNYSANLYDEINFPAFPQGVSNCNVCHGATNTRWQDPTDRTHPSGQVKATRSWRATCGACHSSTTAQAHIDGMTALATNGAEACAVCHGQDRPWAVKTMHMTR
jgi:hypothetical protein